MAQEAIRSARQKRATTRHSNNGLLATLLRPVRAITARVKQAITVANERHTLSQLNDHQLRDIGLSRDRVRSELTRGVFDIPSQRYYDLGLRQPTITSSSLDYS